MSEKVRGMSKEDVKKRRKKRIEQLLRQPRNQTQQPPIPRTASSQHRRSDDPEYVWKNQPPPWSDEFTASSHWEHHSHGGKRRRRLNAIICLLLFFGIFLLFQIEEPWADQGKKWIEDMLTRQGNFEKIAEWYEHKFHGSPAFIPAFHNFWKQDAAKADSKSKRTYHVPLPGRIVVPFEVNREGIHILPDRNEPVKSIDEGRVIFSGYNDRIGNMVIVQHPGGVWSIYGQLQDAKVKLNDWVEGGSVIGTAAVDDQGAPKPYYFAVRIDGTIMDPSEVIVFNE